MTIIVQMGCAVCVFWSPIRIENWDSSVPLAVPYKIHPFLMKPSKVCLI